MRRLASSGREVLRFAPMSTTSDAPQCTVGVFGSDVMRAYKAVGFGVNVAARLQTAADPGSILCGFRTYALVKERVTAEERGALSVKGAARPVEAWETTGVLEP